MVGIGINTSILGESFMFLNQILGDERLDFGIKIYYDFQLRIKISFGPIRNFFT